LFIIFNFTNDGPHSYEQIDQQSKNRILNQMRKMTFKLTLFRSVIDLFQCIYKGNCLANANRSVLKNAVIIL